MSGEFFLAIELWRICLLWLEFLSHRRQSHLNCTCNALSTQHFFPYQSISTWKHMKWKENVYKRHLNYLIYYWNILLTDWIFKKTYSLFFSTHLRFWSLPVWYQKVLHVYDFFFFSEFEHVVRTVENNTTCTRILLSLWIFLCMKHSCTFDRSFNSIL